MNTDALLESVSRLEATLRALWEECAAGRDDERLERKAMEDMATVAAKLNLRLSTRKPARVERSEDEVFRGFGR